MVAGDCTAIARTTSFYENNIREVQVNNLEHIVIVRLCATVVTSVADHPICLLSSHLQH